jgi:exodeoxyribonuclease X
MDGLLFLDTETTGNNLLTDHLFQISFLYSGQMQNQYFKPPVPISIKSQSITHVTNKMVDDKPVFKDSEFAKALQETLRKTILVAHNAQFDTCMLAKEGIEVPEYICTLKVARALDEEGVIPEYNLQYLRYYLEMEIEGTAHEAESDVLVLEALFKRLFAQMREKYQSDQEVLDKMKEISSQPFLFKHINFGKHRGKTIKEVAEQDKSYLEWLLAEKMKNKEGEEDWIFTLKQYLKT